MSDAPQVNTITSRQAHQLVQDNPKAILVDVRSSMEFLFIGHPTGAINVPWIDEPDWKVNPHFAVEVRKLVLGGLSHLEGAHNDVPIVLICRSGKRSLEAGEVLIKDGFRDVYNVGDGFEGELDDHHHRSTINGWRFEGLPWEQC
ncbi:MAG: sulfurtransferase [Gammaproteobacteria bacterium SG8_47]|nr:MAG: sulfurtransferase [Gammaproteobacteria bacterium SG8_47]